MTNYRGMRAQKLEKNGNVIYGWPSKVDEMSCICAGANFLLKNIADESFMYERQQTPHYMFQSSNPNDLYPYLLVNWFWNNNISNFERALLFYQPKDQSMKFSWKNIENWRSWKMRFFWVSPSGWSGQNVY